ncbi:UDP-glucosyltransferase 2-like [Periplaneta americana]|uniref:UDP-glucosyltransferase 2-like n=1 Tax=Periplaneta americana TaxID=6978 RepID=UPI0037E876AD
MRCWHVLLAAAVMASFSVSNSEGARILALFSLNGRSHFVMFEALLKGLASRGHQVDVVGFFPQKKPVPNYTDISVEDALPVLLNNFTVQVVRNFGYINLLDFIWQTNLEMCEKVLQHPNVQTLIKNREKYDLIITEVFGPDCFIGFSHYFKAPFISMTSSVALPWANDRLGNPDNPSYIPDYFLPYTQHMNFGQRIVNLVLTELLKVGHYIFAELPMDKVSRKYLGEDIPPLSELKKKTSLYFVNSHFSLNIPRPTVPAFIEIGGIHIESGGKLPKDLETYINEAKHGVIYFCLGSLVRPETMPKEKLQAFIDVFSELPQRVLWKTNDIPGLPSNVKTSKWFPQFEILSHPNVRAFITHGGLMGTQEGVQAGVPMVGIPLFADQELNIRNCMSKGVSVMVLYDDVTKETLSNALKTVLNDPSYQKNAKHLSQLFRDRPQPPLETAIFWTEYVIRHGGAPHIRSAAVDLPWYQYLLLDVIAVIVLAFAAVMGIVYFVLKTIFGFLCRSKHKKVKKN